MSEQNRFSALEIKPLSGPVKDLEIHGTVHDNLHRENPGKAIIFCEDSFNAFLVARLLNQREHRLFEKEI